MCPPCIMLVVVLFILHYLFWLFPNSKIAYLRHKIFIVSCLKGNSSAGRLYSTALWCFEKINRVSSGFSRTHVLGYDTLTVSIRPLKGVMEQRVVDWRPIGDSCQHIHQFHKCWGKLWTLYSFAAFPPKAKVLNKRTQLCHPSYSWHPPSLFTLLSAFHMSCTFKMHLQHKWPNYSQLFHPVVLQNVRDHLENTSNLSWKP